MPPELYPVSLNSGFRLDLLLEADRPIGNYWITAQSQFRCDSITHFGAKAAL